MMLIAVLLLYCSFAAPLSLVKPPHLGVSGLNLLADPPDAEIDIVAVHGLDGHWQRSWTAKNGVFWLQDILPKHLPKTRIYSYSHGSMTRGGDSPLTLEISDHGIRLVADLTDERELTETEQRPIIFVSHSLGGLIVKSALLHSDTSRVGHLERQKSIKLSTYGVLFLGTPHQGAQGTDLAKVVTTILSIVSHTDIKPLEQMAPNSDWLMSLQERYNAISQDFETTFYYETLEMPLPFRGRLLVVPKSSAIVFGAVNAESIPLKADHSTMVKFTGQEDENFLKVAKKLELYSRKAVIAVKKKWQDWDLIKVSTAPHGVYGNIEEVSKEFKLGVTFKPVWNRHFTGRNQTLQLMDDILRLERQEHELQVGVIYGTGGVGKTQLALEYAHQHQKDYTSIFWIDAHRSDTVAISMRQCFKHIMEHYRLHGMETNPRFQFLEKEEKGGRLSEAFLTWLAYEYNRSWLLIIDNLDDLESVSLRRILPSTSRGSVLITSRRSDLAITWDAINVPAMEHDEAFALLSLSSQIEPEIGTEDWKSAQTLIHRLAYLPLALSQAGAYIGMHRSKAPFTKYLSLYQRYPKDILSQKARQLEWDAKDDTVLTTWEISFTAVQIRMPEAAEILSISGCLAPEGIPQELFEFGGFFSELQVQQAFGLLRSFSFVQQSIGASDVAVHPLIHLWTRLRLNLDEQDATMQKALAMMKDFFYESGTSMTSHASHAWSIYKERLQCAPADYIDLSVTWYNATERNVFNLYPCGKAMHIALSYAKAAGHYVHGFGPQPSESESFNLYRRDTLIWRHIERMLFDYDIAGWKESEDIPAWLFCRAAKFIPSDDPDVLGDLFGYSQTLAFERPRRDDEEDPGETDARWYAWLLIWYGQSNMNRHPVIAGLQVGFGLILQICHAEMTGLLEAYGYGHDEIDTDSFNHRHDNINICIMRNSRDSPRYNDLFRAIVSWSLATAVFCLQDPYSMYGEWMFLPKMQYTRDATDPLSKAVLDGHIGDGVENTAPYMLLHLLDWKGSLCLRYWPYSLTYLARHSFVLLGNEFGEQSARQLADFWSYERGERVPPELHYTYEYYSEDGEISCCIDKPSWEHKLHRRIQIERPRTAQNSIFDITNESVCQTGQLALYLMMWYVAAGNATGAHFWLSNVHARPHEPQTESRNIQWSEKCVFHQNQSILLQSRLSFVEDASDFPRLANYNTDRVFDYITNAAVDLLRGFHYNAIRKGRFADQATQKWPEISKSIAQLLLRPGMHKAATQDADFAHFLMHSGNVPEGATLSEKRALQAWDTYGKKCPGRILRKTIIDSISWFTSQKKLPVFCFIENPLSVACPAVQNGLRKDGGLIGGNNKDSFIKRIWKGLRRSGG